MNRTSDLACDLTIVGSFLLCVLLCILAWN